MRIGLITGEYPPMEGGIADYTRIVAEAMAVQGHSVFILTSAGVPSREADGVTVEGRIRNWNGAFFGAVADWVKQRRLEVVNLQFQTAAYDMAGLVHFLPTRLRLSSGAPFITTFHDLRFPYLFPKAGALRPWIVRQLAGRSAGVIVTNGGDETALRARFPALPLARIPLGATVAVHPEQATARAAIRAALNADESALVVGHFGFVNAVKGVDTLIQAVHLAGEAGLKVKLVMLGGRTGSSDPTNQGYADSIDALAESLGVRPHWTGFLSDADISAYFYACDVLALPFKDGASLRRTSLQAGLAHGRAIITTPPTDSAIPEFEDGHTLLYTPIGDASALAAALSRLAGDSALRQRLEVGALAAARLFDWEQIAARMVAFYAEVQGR